MRPLWALPEVAVIVAIVLARLTGILQPLEWSALDAGLRSRPTEPVDERIVIVGIQESDIRGAGQYPIPDQRLATILNTLQTYQPAVIGVDIFRDMPVAPGHAELLKALQANNVIAVEQVLSDRTGFTVNPPPTVPPERIGFVDAFSDPDGKQRRALLGTVDEQENYRFSLAVQLAKAYLQPKGMQLDNGLQNPDAMRFGSTELPLFYRNSGGYVNADAGGVQMLINFRNRRNPFRFLSLQDLQQGVNPDWLRGKIVLIGYTAPSVKDSVNSTAIATDNPPQIYGVEMHAHVVSQILSATLDGRPFLQVWLDGFEYLWIITWGVVGIGIGRGIRSPQMSFLGLAIVLAILLAGSYGLLLLGWWIPVVPALLALVINGAGLAAFYRYDEALRSRLADRQIIIEQTFNTIHSGPLQTLAQLLRQVKSEDAPPAQILTKLEQLNAELRHVYDAVRQEALTEANSLYLDQERELDLQAPLHKTLYEVYTTVMERDFSGFQTIKLKVFQFEPLDECYLTTEQKRGLCRFLEEALCNVGKHAVRTTRLEVTCAQIEGRNLIRVADNGIDEQTNSALAGAIVREGLGTRQARNLAKQLGGQFQRLPNSPKGTICELSWTTHKRWFWSKR